MRRSWRKSKRVVLGGGMGGSESAAGGGDAQPRQAGQHTSGEKAEGGEKDLCFTG